MKRSGWIGWIALGVLFLVSCSGSLPVTLSDLSDLAVTPTEEATVTPTPSITPTPETDPYSIQGLLDFMSTIDQFNEINRQIEATTYMGQLPASPITSQTQAAVVYQGPGFRVELNGDLNNWIFAERVPFTQVADTDMWVLLLDLEAEARIDYQIIIDGEREILDPLNPTLEVSGFGPRSKLIMPGYSYAAEVAPGLPPLAPADQGSLTQRTLESEALGQTRTIFVYKPARDPADGRYPTLYVNDGTDYLNLINTTVILDRLIAAGEIPPLVAVFVPPIDRSAEYASNLDYVNFLADEVVPFMQSTYPVSRDPADTGILGASLGGLAAGHAAVSRPDVFGHVASQSGAFSLNDREFIRLIELKEPVPVEFHLIVGSYETAVSGDPIVGNLIQANRDTRDLLIQKGYAVSYEELPEGHSWGLWRDEMGTMLKQMFSN